MNHEEIRHTLDEPDELFPKYRVFREPEDDLPEDRRPPSDEGHPVRMIATYPAPLSRSGYELAEEVQGFLFVLKPDSDHHARVALSAYAASVAPFKPGLAKDLRDVLSEWGE